MQIAKIKTFLTILALTCSISGCGDSANLAKLHEDFEAKPENYDQMMTEANKCASSNRSEKALYWYKQAIANAEGEYGPNDARIANAAMYDASLSRSINKLGEAEEMYKRAYEINLKLLPASSPQLLQLKKDYAETLVANYKLDEAKKIYPAVRTPADNLKHRKVKAKH